MIVEKKHRRYDAVRAEFEKFGINKINANVVWQKCFHSWKVADHPTMKMIVRKKKHLQWSSTKIIGKRGSSHRKTYVARASFPGKALHRKRKKLWIGTHPSASTWMMQMMQQNTQILRINHHNTFSIIRNVLKHFLLQVHSVKTCRKRKNAYIKSNSDALLVRTCAIKRWLSK